MKLTYEAFDQAGQAVADSIEAASAEEATETLRRKGLFVTEISAARGGAAADWSRKGRRFGRGARMRNLTGFARQLHVLLVSGTPLVAAMTALERQAKNERWRAVLTNVRTRVEEGASLSEALKDQPHDFDAVSRSLVAAGESGGNLDSMLDRLASLKRQQLHVYRLVVGSMTYPILLIIVSLGVLAMLLMFVLPRFTMMFEMLDAPLPPTTELLVIFSDLLRRFWWAALILAVGGTVGLRRYLRTPGGRRLWDRALIRLPLVGPVMRSLATARIVRLLGVLLDSHVPLLESLQLTREAAGNVHYADLITHAEQAATRGESLSSALAGPGLISATVIEAIRSGEQSGQLASLLVTVADFHDEDNEVVVKALTNIIGPLILVALGVMVGFVAVSLFLPLFDLTSMTSTGGGG